MASLIPRAREFALATLDELPRRQAHVSGVARAAAEAVARCALAEQDEIVAAAWLHDIGYAEPLNQTGFHPVDGARFLRDSCFPELVVSLVAFHTGALVEAEERGLSDELTAFAPPPSELLDVLTFADVTTSPVGEPIPAEARIEEILSRYPVGDPVHRAISRSAPELLASVERVGRLIAAQPK